MKIKNKEVYYCEYCNKHGLSKHKMQYHEKICFKNPENFRPCFDCENLIKKETIIYNNHYDGREREYNVSLLYCNEYKMFLYTPKNEIKQNQYDLGDKTNNHMPKECLWYNNYHESNK